jgi:hypothetical protein
MVDGRPLFGDAPYVGLGLDKDMPSEADGRSIVANILLDFEWREVREAGVE